MQSYRDLPGTNHIIKKANVRFTVRSDAYAPHDMLRGSRHDDGVSDDAANADIIVLFCHADRLEGQTVW